MKNWWYYHKWYVVCGILLFGVVCNLIGNALGIWKKEPDFQIAYVGTAELPQDTVSALEQAFASAGGDFNGDGEVIVQINQYVNSGQVSDAETAYYEYASELTLIGDISDCQSYFFLMDNPKHFQRNFHLLACPDGSCPDTTDYDVDDKIFSWNDCPYLSQLDLGSYSYTLLSEKITGNNLDLLSGLYIGRRCFYNDKQTDYSKNCSELWDFLITPR